jgi:TRAP-type C4-dicarboxylate transport system permease small subunit
MFYRILSWLVETMVIVMSTVIVSIVTIEVILRYVFSSSLIFTEELSRYLMVWVVFLGSSIAVRDGAHIRISMALNFLPLQWQRAAAVTADLLILVFLGVTAVEGIRILPKQLSQMPTTLDVPMFWFYLAIPVGSLLMIIFLWPSLWRSFSPDAERALEGRRQDKC